MKEQHKWTVKKAFLCVLVFILCTCFSSCSGVFSDPKSLMSPPKASGELSGIEDALSEAISLQYSFVYPSAGNYRSACITQDIAGDENEEAIVFYQLTDNNEIHMNYLCKINKKWKSYYDMKLVCTSVDRVDFADLCGDKTKELLIGCNLYNENEKELYIYSVNNSELSQLTQESYTDFTVCSLSDGNKPQVMLFTLGSNTALNYAEADSASIKKYATAKLISLDSVKSGVTTVVGNAIIDHSITSISSVVQSKTDDGYNALYVDAYKGANVMITEILYFDKSRQTLVNVFCNEDTGENSATRRQVLLNCRDINNDDRYEIPFGNIVPGYESKDFDSKLYYSSWKSYTNGSFVDVCTGLFNATDRYFIKIPDKWLNYVTITLDRKNSTVVFSEYDSKKNKASVELLSLKIFDENSFNVNRDGYTAIVTKESRVIAAKIFDNKSKYAVNMEFVEKNLSYFG